MTERRVSEPTELIYLPTSSWPPALLAAGLGGVIASIFTWWPYGAIGAVVAIFALIAWIREARSEFGRLPRQQRVTTAAIPAVPPRRSQD
jgi:fatty acid desaturase